MNKNKNMALLKSFLTLIRLSQTFTETHMLTELNKGVTLGNPVVFDGAIEESPVLFLLEFFKSYKTVKLTGIHEQACDC